MRAVIRRPFASWLFSVITLLPLTPGALLAAGEEFKFVALADTHISSEADLANWRKFLYTVQQQENPDMFIVMGDIVGHEPHLLARAKQIADLSGAVVHCVPGNHDDDYGRYPEYYQAAFGSMYYAFDHKGWKMVMGWSQNPPTAWLRSTLDALPAGTPVIYCGHYPPAYDSASYDVIKDYATRVAFAGHTHAESSYTYSGVPVRVLGQCRLTSGPYYVYTARDETPFNFSVTRKYASDLTLLSPPDAPPTISLASPASGSTISGTVLFSGTAGDDSSLSEIHYRVDLGPWLPLPTTTSWTFSLDTTALSEEHHLVEFRSIDSAGQETLNYASGIYYVDNLPSPANVLSFQQGVNSYTGCTARTITSTDASRSNLECWTWSSGAEFHEFYVRFDLSGLTMPSGSDITSARLILYLVRQNNQSLNGGAWPANYNVGIVGGHWDASTTWATRPAPAWTAANTTSPAPALTGAWDYFDFGYGTYPAPPQPIEIDLTAIAGVIQGWAETPAGNYGLVFSPKTAYNYNFSMAQSNYWLATARPRLEITLEDGGADATPPDITLSAAVLAGTVSDDVSCPAFVSVAGTQVPVSSAGPLSGTWTSQNVSLSGQTTTIAITAGDNSGNSRTVHVQVAK